MLETAERLIISEIGDYTATLPNPDYMPSAPQMHDELIARVQRVFADIRQQKLHEQPSITVKELHKEHWLIKAGYAMCIAHSRNETLNPAVEEVTEQYLQLNREMAIAMWVAVNAKSNAGAQ
jgi:hypothetical protein